MLAAVIAGLVTLIALALAIVLLLRSRRDHDKSHVLPTNKVKSIENFGVNPLKQGGAVGKGQDQAVQVSHPASGSPSDGLKSRFVAMGVLSACIFGTLAVRLWVLQVLNGSSYKSQAEENTYTTVYTPAPRGVIYDADGIALVKNRSNYTVLATSDVADDHDVVQRLSVLLGIPHEVVRQRILDTSSGAQNSRIVAEDASLRSLAYISEHADAFTGVSYETRTTRTYPYGALAAHVLGYVGTVSEEELEETEEGRDLESGDVVGKSGVEGYYDSVLAGEHGTRQILTTADGDIEQVVSETDPTQGNDIYLTLSARVQQVADKQLRKVIAPDGELGSGYGTGGAIVCMDCTNGEILAMASFPTFEPESFIGGITQDAWDAYNTDDSHYPLMNRAIAGTYPAASTFKAFVSAAALSYDIASDESTYTCEGTWEGFGEEYSQDCWQLSGHGTLDLVGGIANSCDVVFYEIGKAFYDKSDSLGEDCLQQYIASYGFGSETGIDLSGEATGRIPTPEWKAEYYKDVPEEAEWLPGDMSNMSIGQGYVLVTPLQMCCAYCGIATGVVYKPHLLKEVRNSSGETVLSIEPEVLAEPDLKDEDAELVREGLEEVMTLNGYTSSYFSDIGCDVAGKTGTAEVSGQVDYTWFACYAPADDPKYVAACVCEQGSVTTKTTVPMLGKVLTAAVQYGEGTLSKKVSSISATYETVDYEVDEASRTD